MRGQPIQEACGVLGRTVVEGQVDERRPIVTVGFALPQAAR